MMYPSLRGGNDNPGKKEGFLGEVDDVLAAAEYLLSLPYVDPSHLYLGGHSTGGTLVLLVAASTDKFAATFSFGPADKVAGYGPDSPYLPYDQSNPEEHDIRSPIKWVSDIKTPVYVIEGYNGNADSLMNLQGASLHANNSNLRINLIQKTDHFAVLEPVNRYLAQAILKASETGELLSVDQEEVRRRVWNR